MAPKGRIAIISFHSLEDRIVKHVFKDAVLSGYGLLLTKTPVTASHVELLQNPRARSAKLRVYESVAPYVLTSIDTRPHHAYV